jgi:glyoxylase-like metal-dependent hydrolase (beta-lactamase superfamily II)
LGNAAVKEKFNIPLYLHRKDLATLQSVKNYAALYGFQAYKESPYPDFFLEDKTEIVFQDIVFKVYFTPGHPPGHVVFYNEANSFVINGDVLFNGSFGRVDLPGGDINTLKNSIFDIMFTLPENTTVYCGHGPETTIGQEKESNYIHQF